MERIIRLNAVENLCLSGIFGMNEHPLHPSEHLAPQKLNISGVGFDSPIGVFLNTPNTKFNYLLQLSAVIESKQFFGAFLQALKSLSNLVLSLSINFAIILATGGWARKIEPVALLSRKSKLLVVRTFNKIKPEVVPQKQKTTGDEKVFYDKPTFTMTNLPYRQVDVFDKEDKVQTKLAHHPNWDCEFMCGKVITTYKDKQTSEKLVEAYQVDLLSEGEK